MSQKEDTPEIIGLQCNCYNMFDVIGGHKIALERVGVANPFPDSNLIQQLIYCIRHMGC